MALVTTSLGYKKGEAILKLLSVARDMIEDYRFHNQIDRCNERIRDLMKAHENRKKRT